MKIPEVSSFNFIMQQYEDNLRWSVKKVSVLHGMTPKLDNYFFGYRNV